MASDGIPGHSKWSNSDVEVVEDSLANDALAGDEFVNEARPDAEGASTSDAMNSNATR
jgi:hypothetical protein